MDANTINTLPHVTAKLSLLEKKLRENKMHSNILLLNESGHNCFIIRLNHCDCSAAATISVCSTRPVNFIVTCTQCKKKVLPRRRAWEVKLNWNMQNLKNADLNEFPFFGIQSCPLNEASKRLKEFSEYLQLKTKQENLKSEIDKNYTPEFQYTQRLKCFHLWALYGFQIINYRKNLNINLRYPNC